MPYRDLQFDCPACEHEQTLALNDDGDWVCSECDSRWADTGEGPDFDEG